MHYLHSEAWHRWHMKTTFARKQRGFIIDQHGTAPGGGDPNFANVSLLLHLDDGNGSTNIIDSSGTPKTCTASGGIAQSTAQARYGASSVLGNYTTTLSDHIQVLHDTALHLPGDLTIEASCWWINAPTAGQSSPTFFAKKGAATDIEYWFLQIGNDLYFYYTTDGTTFQWVTVAFTPSTGQWYDIAFSRVGSNAYFLVDGAQQGSTQTVSGTIYSAAQNASIFTDNINNGTFNGYLDEIRVTKGVGRYNASGYTPAPFPDF